MIPITKKEIEKGFRDYQYYLIGRTGSFLTSLFEAISHADSANLNKLATIYPEYVYAHLDYAGGMYQVNFYRVEEQTIGQ